MLSIIIPTLNEERSICHTLDAVSRLRGSAEVIVVDGGSLDETVPLVAGRGVRLIMSNRGRGAQMHAGACAARGEALWFLHADTRPSEDAVERIAEALADPQVIAGNFSISFEGVGTAARFLTWLYPYLRKLGLFYGDSAIFVRREAYYQAGGFKAFPIFEDLDFMERLRPLGRVVRLRSAVVTSSRRFEGRIFALTFARWASLQLLYWLGVHPNALGRLYAPIRNARARN